MNVNVRFCLSSNWKAPRVPLLNVDQEFIDKRNSEINDCFGQLEVVVANLDLSSNKGYDDFLKVKNVIEQLRAYRFEINQYGSKGKAFVPYTASDKGRYLWANK